MSTYRYKRIKNLQVIVYLDYVFLSCTAITDKCKVNGSQKYMSILTFLLSPTPTAYSMFQIFQTCHVQHKSLDIFNRLSDLLIDSAYFYILVAKYKREREVIFIFFLSLPIFNLSIILAALSSGSENLLSFSQLSFVLN